MINQYDMRVRPRVRAHRRKIIESYNKSGSNRPLFLITITTNRILYIFGRILYVCEATLLALAYQQGYLRV